ncbi:hypothetical protein [Paramaledivibacter caminithermalis]|jgi:hypothetical protein|uniref:Uncharacterized protein n=1 Tax=Paramaledivibacter caminithermalis (strain DSM 15212 / CIP 107654 / DViRD3) TaxID=1121301 RepID=A0A1M6NZW7_PARC5|nr:hypothetical protein [Paramaledivibacter caminithermalis]SHK01204.1 hypothetical protein SAMN02745912_01957 [Paramaledivibacter caminithermalis DSM 15212]
MKKIISLILVLTMAISVCYISYADSKHIKISKEELASMPRAKREVLEKAFNNGKRLLRIEKRVVELKKDANGRLVPIDPKEEIKTQNIKDSLISAKSISENSLTLELYVLDNTREGSSYPVDYSFMGWFEWNGQDPAPGEYDFAGITWDGGLALYKGDQVAYDWIDRETTSGEEDMKTSRGYVAKYKYYNGVSPLKCGWVFADVRQNQKQNLQGNVKFTYFHTYSSLNYSVSISNPPSLDIKPDYKNWDKFSYTTFWY